MRHTITLITVTYNAKDHLTGLIKSLREQTDRDFEWIVVDGLSTDGTRELIMSAGDLVTNWLSERDFGIYDAINKALFMAKGDYYLVLGADDRLNAEAIAKYKEYAYRTKADIITAKIVRKGKIERRKPCWPWLYAHHAYVSEHSVGSLIHKALHQKFGFYSNRYAIGADLLFLKKVCSRPETTVLRADFVAGVVGYSGISRKDRAGAICDYFRGQLETEKSKYLQIVLFMVKLLKNARSIVKTLRL